MNDLEKLYGEPYINDELLDRVDFIKEDSLLHDDTWKTWEKRLGDQEARALSDWCRTLQGLSKSELAVATIVAMENYPFMVLQIVAEYIIKKEEKKDERD